MNDRNGLRISPLVSDVMTAPAITVDESTAFNDIVALLEEHRISSVPVVDRKLRLIGVVSEADLLVKQNAGLKPRGAFESDQHNGNHAKDHGYLARDLMSRGVITARANFPVTLVARQMYERRLKSMPVVTPDDEVLGMIARRDVLRAFVSSDAEIKSDVTAWLRRYRKSSTRGVTVGVREGVVTLTGVAMNPADADLLATLAGGVVGVVSVQSRLDILGDEDPVEEPAEPWARS